MQKILFVLASLACAGHGWRTQASRKRMQRHPVSRSQTDTSNPVNALSSLLMGLNQDAAFNPIGSPLGSPALAGSRTAVAGRRHPMMITSEASLPSKNSAAMTEAHTEARHTSEHEGDEWQLWPMLNLEKMIDRLMNPKQETKTLSTASISTDFDQCVAMCRNLAEVEKCREQAWQAWRLAS
mmetsp:Transcript_96613/g.181674  ORF Transcript_96613/g.181674 Transcript_96613/m.181674 type:complete len:182 (-) Transcript_96613:129-674(-)